MKRCCLLLLALLITAGLWQTYHRIDQYYQTHQHDKGNLSDIAEEVIAIPLQPTKQGQIIRQVREVHKEGNDLFLISQNILYHFNRKGEFINQITQPEEITVAGYLVNTLNRQLIVFGNQDDIYYYNFEGNLLKKKKLKSDLDHYKLMSATLYQNHIFTTESKMKKDPDSGKIYLHREVVEYNLDFQKIAQKPLIDAYLGKAILTPSATCPHLGISPDSGHLYAHTQSSQSASLLKDSLYLFHQEKTNDKQSVPIYPIRKGNRFWLTSYHNQSRPQESYTFCFDPYANESWEVKGGFQDDFYSTGKVLQLNSMDLLGETYTFTCQGKALENSFPNEAKTDSTVVFIVKLKA